MAETDRFQRPVSRDGERAQAGAGTVEWIGTRPGDRLGGSATSTRHAPGRAAENARLQAFIGTAQIRPSDLRLAIALIVVSFVSCALAIPFADSRWPVAPAFIAAYEAALIIIDLMTAQLLVAQFRDHRTPSILIVASGYYFDAFIVAAHAASFPEVFSTTGLLTDNRQTTPWLYIFWHGVFPLFIGAYALISHTPRDAPLPAGYTRPAIAVTIVAAAAVAGVCVLVATVGIGYLPEIIRGNDYTRAITSGIAPAAWATSVLALLLLWHRTRARTMLDLWLIVVMVAWTLDILLSTLVSHARYDFGWYAGRIYGLIAASVVLAALLTGASRLYARLVAALALAEERAAALEAKRSELASSQEQFRQAQKMQAIGNLTGGIAHDFQNLLAIVDGYTRLILRNVHDPDRIRQLTEYLRGAAQRGERLVKQLLTFSRREAFRPERIDVNELLREFEPLIQHAVGAERRLELKLAAGPALTTIDPAQLEAAVLNLVVNARDATPPEGRITVATGATTVATDAAAPGVPPGSYVVIAVEDTGTGIPPEILSRVFEPFFTTKEPGKGTGLGLSQVYGFVQESGGFLDVSSKPGEGTTIRLHFPAEADYDQQSQRSA